MTFVHFVFSRGIGFEPDDLWAAESMKEKEIGLLSPKEVKAMRRNAGEATSTLRMLSHEARLSVLCDLVAGERSAGALVESSGLGQSALSQHLAKLREQGLVETRREGQTIFYRLSDRRVARLISLLHELYCGKD